MRAESVDVVIVGSGPVGAAYARTLSDLDPGLRILHLEAGPRIAEPAGRHVKTIADPVARAQAQIDSQGPTAYPYPTGATSTARVAADAPIAARAGTFLLDPDASVSDAGMPAAALSSNVGGMGAHWTCACPPPAFDERIAFIDDDEWEDLFAEASRLLHVSSTAFDGAPLGAEVRAVLGGLLDEGRRADRRVQPMPLGICVDADGRRHWTGADVVLGDLASGTHPSYDLRAEHRVERVLLAEDGTARGVRVHDLRADERYEVEARAVVIAADALRTPQLLFASGIRPAALGRYLNEHPQVIGIARLDDAFVPAAARTTPAPGEVAAESGVSWIPYHGELFPFHGQIMQADASPVPLDDAAQVWPGSIVGVGFFCPKEIRAEDRLEFDESTPDWAGLPAITIHYGLSEQDLRTIDTAVAHISDLLDALGTPAGGRAPIVMPAGSSMHYMGTVRMGTVDDGTSVCGPDGTVWGAPNLVVGGNGVIPTATAGNPTATSVALAVRGARAIIARLRDARTQEGSHHVG